MESLETGSALHLPYTIERQLQAYGEAERSTERHQTLWHAWKQNKSWLTHFLELTITSFPTYSRHDATHAQMVLHNIELVLGEERIRQLSPTDCFLLLHVVYVHDIGMCITAEDRQNAVASEDFEELIKDCEGSNDIAKTKWAACLKQHCYDYMHEEATKDYRRLYQDKLDTYNSLINLLAEYIRAQHGKRSQDRLVKWTTDREKLGAGFAFSGIPNRIFSRMAECAGLHTESFEKLLELPQEDSGYAHDRMHPRFIAVLLQLGDALDVDNDRFHPFVLELVGELPGMSELHFEKHNAIRMLQITPNEISIAADCQSVEVLHLIRQECDGIEELLKNASYHWSKISPGGFMGCLPSMNSPTLKLNGASIPKELVNARFSIPQEKAFQLLEGANLYGDYFPFIRELLQNAYDATKLQYWTDYRGSAYYQRKKLKDEHFHEPTFAIKEQIKLIDYPIEIFLSIQAVDKYGNELSAEDAKLCPNEVDYGVCLEIQDHGVGMTQEDIIAISRVGTSHSKNHKFINEMPDILKPTGEFGIGLQSVFTVSPQFKCDTRAHNGEAYRIVFSEASRKNDGIISATPLENSEICPFGTKFHVFVARKNKIDHHKFLQAWAGFDYFASDYEKDYKLHEAEELMAQIIYYLREILGEKLFPICVIAHDPFSENLPYNLKNISADDKKFTLRVLKKNEQPNDEFLLDSDQLANTLGWAFQDHAKLVERKKVAYRKKLPFMPQDTQDTQEQELEFYSNENLFGAFRQAEHLSGKGLRESKDIYYLDPVDWKLYLWCEKVRTFACLSADRFLDAYYKPEDTDGKAKLYYKGVKLHATADFRDDLGLIEYLDIKHGDTRQCLQLNRDQLTDEGLRYLQADICPAVLETAYSAMQYIANQIQQDKYEGKISLLDHFDEILKQRFNQLSLNIDQDFAREQSKALLSLTLICYFGKSSYIAHQDSSYELDNYSLANECPWEQVLCMLSKHMQVFIDKRLLDASKPLERNIEFLFAYCHGIRASAEFSRLISIPSLLSSEERLYIHSVRQHRNAVWQHRIISAIPEVRIYADNMRQLSSPKNISDKDMEYAFRLLWQSTRRADMSNADMGILSNVRYSNHVARWMLHNIASEKVMTYLVDREDTGNTRLNLLTTGRVHEVFFNSEMLYLLLRKMDERNQTYNAKRFSTIVWSGFSHLQVKRIPFTVCEINRGYISPLSKPRMLLPLHESDIQVLLHLYEDEESMNGEHIGHYIPRWRKDERFINKIKEIVQTVNDFQELIGSSRYLRAIYDRAVEAKSSSVGEIDTLDQVLEMSVSPVDNEVRALISRFKKMDLLTRSITDKGTIISRDLDSSQELSDIRESRVFSDCSTLAAWLQCGLMNMFENMYLQDSRLESLIKPFYGRNQSCSEDIENLIAYIRKNGTQHPSRDKVLAMFAEIYARFADSVKSIHKEEFMAFLKRECGYNSPMDKTEGKLETLGQDRNMIR